MKKLVFLCFLGLIFVVSVGCSSDKNVESQQSTTSVKSSVADNDSKKWKDQVYQAIEQSTYKAPGKDELIEMPLDDYYDLVEGESTPRKRDAYTRDGESYIIVGAEFANLRERLPGKYLRYFYNSIGEDGSKEYIASFYIDTLTEKIYLEDYDGDIMDLKTGDYVTFVDRSKDPLAKYPAKDITEKSAGRETLSILQTLKILDDPGDYQTSVEIPDWKEIKQPQWWEQEKDTLYDGYYSIVIRDKTKPANKNLTGYYIISKDGRQLQQYSQRNEAYDIIYGTRIATNTLNSSSGAHQSSTAPSIPEDILQQTGIVVISGMEQPSFGDSISNTLLPLQKRVTHFTHESEVAPATHRALLISANDNTRIQLFPVTGWNEETSSLDTGDPIFDGIFDRGTAFIVDYFEAETIPTLLAIVTAEDGHTRTGFDFSYDGSGDSTENGISYWIRYYGFPEKDPSIDYRDIIDYLYQLAVNKKNHDIKATP